LIWRKVRQEHPAHSGTVTDPDGADGVTPIGEAGEHFRLTLGMAASCGIDLGGAMLDGVITQKEYADAITNCRRCQDPGPCRAWLAARNAAAAPPPFCKNGALFSEMMRLSAEP
jgi:hypothetical protein